MADGIKDALISLMRAAFRGFDTSVADATDVLIDGLGNWDAMLGLSETLKPFCLIIISICLLIELAQVAAKVDMLKWEHGLRICIKVVLAKVCIDIAPTFLKACYLQAQDWISSLSTSGGSLGTTAEAYLEPLINSVTGLGSVLGLFLSSSIVLMAVKVCGLIVQVIAYGRMFELYVYLVVSPFPCAFLPLGDGSGGGTINRITSKFFKSFIAVCLQGVMMIIVFRIFDLVIVGAIRQAMISAAGGATDLVYTMLLGAIALVMAMMKSGQWAKSIIDAM